MSTYEAIVLTSVISVIIIVALFLMRYRDRLQQHFNNGPIKIKSRIALNAQAQLYLIEIGQTHYLCGTGREGVNCMTEVNLPMEHS
jgi:flagellar biogenesis protein FliO